MKLKIETKPARPLRPDELNFRETLACIDDNGRCRCPRCGRYARLSQMKKGGSLRGRGFHISLTPYCPHCAEKLERTA